jgi:REP element-mobilizing transposase RayT
MRKNPLVENEYYHIYNRGVDKRNVFLDDSDFRRFLLAMNLLNDERDGLMSRWRDFQKNNPGRADISDFLTSDVGKRRPLVDINAYSLLSNHYHYILKQVAEKGIEKFMQKLGNSYTKYFNERYDRNGALFQGKFKSTHIESNPMLLRMSVYVNCNSEIHRVSSAKNYKWCGYLEYAGEGVANICDTKVIKSHFRSKKDYRDYALENIRDFRERKENEKALLFE